MSRRSSFQKKFFSLRGKQNHQDIENDADTIRPRLDQMKADWSRIHAVSKRVTLDINGCADLHNILESDKPHLIVIDPLFAYTGAKVDIHRDAT